MNQSLDFLVIGAQKCATTWLYECMAEHPEICLPVNKREIEYIGGELFEQNGMGWYLSLMNHAKNGQMIGDVSVEYMFNPICAEMLSRDFPNLKLIISLRNPVERAISAYYWYLRKGILSAEFGSEDSLLKLAKDYKDNFFTEGTDVIERGLYFEQIERYLKCFPPEQVFVVLYEEIEMMPQIVLERVFSFLGVNSLFLPKKVSSKPKKNSYSNWLIWFERLNPKSRIVAAMSNQLNQWLSNPNKVERSTISSATYNEMVSIFSQRNMKLVELIYALPASNRPSSMSFFESWNEKK